MQEAEVGAGSYLSSKASSSDPFSSSVWDIKRGVFSFGTITLATVLALDTVTINGLVYTAVAGVKADNTEFSIDGTDTVDAADLADSINADTRTGTLNDVTASSDGAVVTVTQTVAGAGGDATTLAESTATVRMTLSGAVFTGGGAGDEFSVQFVSEIAFTNASDPYGRAGLSTRRALDIEIVDNANLFTVRSVLAALNFVQGLEDKVAQVGVGATADGTYTDAVLNGFTPYEQFTWTIVKLGDVYTITPTASS